MNRENIIFNWAIFAMKYTCSEKKYPGDIKEYKHLNRCLKGYGDHEIKLNHVLG